MSVEVEGESIIIREALLYDSEWKEVQVRGRAYIIQKHSTGIVDVHCARKPSIFRRFIRRLMSPLVSRQRPHRVYVEHAMRSVLLLPDDPASPVSTFQTLGL